MVRDKGAWPQYKSWTQDIYSDYRRYVRSQAPGFRGDASADCADLSLSLMVRFAAQNGLPLTFTDNDNVRYISFVRIQWPPTSALNVMTWKDEAEYLNVVKRRVGAKALFTRNTKVNPSGPEPGDLMLSKGHAALVFDTQLPFMPHPLRFQQGSIPILNPDAAVLQPNQTEYFSEDPAGAQKKVTVHFDYLNHRGEKKPKAELIYYADSDRFRKLGYEFRMYGDTVIDNWPGWEGLSTAPPH